MSGPVGTALDLGAHDPGAIVWDEVVGLLVTLTAAPPGWVWIVIGFALFRLFDIWKPWPIRVLDARFPGGSASCSTTWSPLAP